MNTNTTPEHLASAPRQNSRRRPLVFRLSDGQELSAEDLDAFVQVIAQIIIEDLQRNGESAILKKEVEEEEEDPYEGQ